MQQPTTSQDSSVEIQEPAAGGTPATFADRMGRRDGAGHDGTVAGAGWNSLPVLLQPSLCADTDTPAAHTPTCILPQIYEQLGGTWKRAATAAGPTAGATDADAADAPPTDIAAALASEVAELKDTAKSPLFYHLTGKSSLVTWLLKNSSSQAGRQPAAVKSVGPQQREAPRCGWLRR